ncbi:hypothetical protein I552_0470 [Mycobacterium xenopi 3993]|nr:hypothetical protein I552_0470 [Mycobacterium xenopi 3993]
MTSAAAWLRTRCWPPCRWKRYGCCLRAGISGSNNCMPTPRSTATPACPHRM